MGCTMDDGAEVKFVDYKHVTRHLDWADNKIISAAVREHTVLLTQGRSMGIIARNLRVWVAKTVQGLKKLNESH